MNKAAQPFPVSHFNFFNLDNGDKIWSIAWKTTSVADLEVWSSQVDLELGAHDDEGAVYGLMEQQWPSSKGPGAWSMVYGWKKVQHVQLAVCVVKSWRSAVGACSFMLVQAGAAAARIRVVLGGAEARQCIKGCVSRCRSSSVQQRLRQSVSGTAEGTCVLQ